ncbi:uncharacterized protein LTR77_010925 [Saxophila tyrrhenica]|uniref:CENP-V/GFA domain-containing protein n=1 Tax=Saxophila tyrrhenica TaxID=1690608 RepID=A0AAV9NV13_9PEZI|nr:hypothetical protein LTR77_010925 [Saxophila tyrrhenica]
MAQSSDTTGPVTAACHCGAVKITVSRKPKEINECQCTLCRRYRAAWAYYDPTDVDVLVMNDTQPREYLWGDREIRFRFCGACGCVTHWRSVDEGGQEMGVNTRMMHPDLLRDANRKVDNEQLSVPLKSRDSAHPEDQARYL